MKRGAILGIILGILIISLASFASAGCVTYSQARANGIKGTDAELHTAGFCPDTDTGTATTPGTTTGVQTTQVDTSDLLGKTEYELSEIWLHELSKLEYKESEDLQNEHALKSSQLTKEYAAKITEIYDTHLSCIGQGRCGKIDILTAAAGDYSECIDQCDEEKETRTVENKQEYEQAQKALYIEEITKTRAAIMALGTGAAGKKGETPSLPGGLEQRKLQPGELEPEFNTNSDRGRDEYGRMNPSIGGYLGDAYVVRSDGTKVIPGKELYLSVKDKVITGKDSKVNIIFSNAGRINLGPDTELRVGNALLDQYYLARGTLKSKINWVDKQKFEINTPNAAVSIRGTEFIMDYNETTGITTILLKEGTLEVTSETYITNLTAGYYCVVHPDGTTDFDQLRSEDWNALEGNFYETELDANVSYWIKVYAWVSFIVMVMSALISMVFTRRARKKLQQQDKNKKDLSRLSLIFGILGIITALWPILGYPLSMTAVALAMIQKQRKPTRTAKIGRILGAIGVILSIVACLNLLIFTAKVFS